MIESKVLVELRKFRVCDRHEKQEVRNRFDQSPEFECLCFQRGENTSASIVNTV